MPASRPTSRTPRVTPASTRRSPTSSSARAAASCCSSTTRARPVPSPPRPRPRASPSSPTTARSRAPTTTCRSTTSKVGELQGQSIVDGLKAAGKDPATAIVVYMGGDPTDGNAKMFHDGADKVMAAAGIEPAAEPPGVWDGDKSRDELRTGTDRARRQGRRRLGRQRHERRGRHHGPRQERPDAFPSRVRTPTSPACRTCCSASRPPRSTSRSPLEADAAIEARHPAAEGRDADGRQEARRRHAVHRGDAGARRTGRGARRSSTNGDASARRHLHRRGAWPPARSTA